MVGRGGPSGLLRQVLSSAKCPPLYLDVVLVGGGVPQDYGHRGRVGGGAAQVQVGFRINSLININHFGPRNNYLFYLINACFIL